MSPSARRLLAAAALVFLLVLIARFPARWAKPLLPKSLTCRELTGSLWSGQCSGLLVNRAILGDARWDLSAASLLLARLSGTLALAQPRAHVDTEFALPLTGGVTLRNLKSEFVLDRALYRNLPQGLAGHVSTDLPILEYSKQHVSGLRGRIEIHDLVQFGVPPSRYGSYEIRFDSARQPNGDIVGVVRDLGGPVAFDGTLKLTTDGHYVLDGRVAARADAPPELAQKLAILGPPDAEGRRPLSIDSSF